MTDDLQLLISAYLNGELPPEETETLRRTLASDPKALTEFVLALDAHAELRKIHLEGVGSTEALKEIRQAKQSRIWKLAAAAAAVVAALLFWLLLPGSVARLETLAGKIRLIDGGELVPGDEIRVGRGVETLSDGRATLRYPDGTSLELGTRTKVQELTRDRVVVAQGKVAARVNPRPADHALVFATPHGEAKVLGTALMLSVEKGSTRLEVTEGRVQLTRRTIGDSVAVAAGEFAVVAKDRAPESRPAVRELVRRMAPNSWIQLPGTQLRQAAPPVSKVKGDPRGVIESWSGAVLDTLRNRLVIWGGGHTNYQGNEVYAFDLESLHWERLTEPIADAAAGRQVNSDGTPISRATYNGLAYLAHADRMFALAGDPSVSGVTPDITWTFDFETNSWQDRKPSGDRPPTWVGATCAYDPATRKVWWGEGRSPGAAGFYSYDFDANLWKKHAPDFFYYQTGAMDTRRGLLVCAGDGKLFAYDVRSGTPVRQVWNTVGAEALLAKGNPGFDYDSAADRLVGWAGGSVYLLHPETKVWRSVDAPRAPKPTLNGIFGRWRYVPSLDVFVLVTSVDENVHFYKLPAGE